MASRPRSREEFAAYFYDRLKYTEYCYEWTGAKTSQGYGVTTFQGQRLLTHRVAMALANREVRAGDFVLHNCDNKLCCRVSHLRVGTHAENMKDASERSVWRRYKPLTTEDVAYVVASMHKSTNAEMAAHCGQSVETIRRICRGDIYNYEARYIGGTHVCRRRSAKQQDAELPSSDGKRLTREELKALMKKAFGDR